MSVEQPQHMNEAQFAATHAKLASKGGFTVNPRTGNDITSGISVAPRGNERRVPIEASSPASLRDYAQDNVHRWTNETDPSGKVLAAHNASLGGWRSENQDVLDTPTVYKDTPGGHTSARRNMVASSQEAGFNLSTHEEIFNPFHPATRRNLGMEPHELAMGAVNPNDPADDIRRSKLALSQPEIQAWINGPANRAQFERERAARSGGRPTNGKKR